MDDFKCNFLIVSILFISLCSTGGVYTLTCFSCSGDYNQLSNRTCSEVTQNDSCLIIVSNVTGGRNWNIQMTAFKEPNTPDDFPYSYKRPASGSSFVEHYWYINGANSRNSYLYEIRYFCYTDKCNSFNLIDQFLNSTIYYETVNVQTPTSNCYRCNGLTYDSVRNCTDMSQCNPQYGCALTANKVSNNDLFRHWNWWSSCESLVKSIFYGSIRTQFEFKTENLNAYTTIVCFYA